MPRKLVPLMPQMDQQRKELKETSTKQVGKKRLRYNANPDQKLMIPPKRIKPTPLMVQKTQPNQLQATITKQMNRQSRRKQLLLQKTQMPRVLPKVKSGAKKNYQIAHQNEWVS